MATATTEQQLATAKARMRHAVEGYIALRMHLAGTGRKSESRKKGKGTVKQTMLAAAKAAHAEAEARTLAARNAGTVLADICREIHNDAKCDESDAYYALCKLRNPKKA